MLFEPKRDNIPLPPGTHRMSMSTVYFQTLLYYDTIYTMVLLPFQMFLFIYKYNLLVYLDNGVKVAQIILLIVAFILNWIRLGQGSIGNKNKQPVRFFVYYFLTIVMIIGFIYLIIWQRYVLWLEFIMHIMALAIVGLEFIVSIIALIAYQASTF